MSNSSNDPAYQQKQENQGLRVDFRLRDRDWSLNVYATQNNQWIIECLEETFVVEFELVTSGIAQLSCFGQNHKILYSYSVAPDGTDFYSYQL